MPNPNFSELILRGWYGPDSDSVQSTKLYSAVSEDSDQTDHKWVEDVPWAGRYVELAHYASVKQIVIQNDSILGGVIFFADATTASVVPEYVAAGEHVSFNNPDVGAGLMVYADVPGEIVTFHLVIIGSLT